MEVNFAYLDWAKTTAFCATPSSNAIRIRVAREPGMPGIQPGDYAAFRAKLISDLYALRGPDGEAVITRIITREDAFPGAAMANAPDLTLTLSDHGFVSVRDRAPAVAPRAYPAGTHHPDGILIASGPGIAPDHTRTRVDLIDVPSMLLHSLGLAVPQDFEGTVPAQLFTRAHWEERPLNKGPSTRPVARDATAEAGPSDAEREKILEQMRALGYLDA